MKVSFAKRLQSEVADIGDPDEELKGFIRLVTRGAGISAASFDRALPTNIEIRLKPKGWISSGALNKLDHLFRNAQFSTITEYAFIWGTK